MALRMPKLVYGSISRTAWHIALLWLANKVFWGGKFVLKHVAHDEFDHSLTTRVETNSRAICV